MSRFAFSTDFGGIIGRLPAQWRTEDVSIGGYSGTKNVMALNFTMC